MKKKKYDIAYDETILGIEALQVEDYRSAFKHFLKAVENGSYESMFHLGNMYYFGYGVEADCGRALHYYLECIETDETEEEYYHQAMLNIGNAYYNGEGVEEEVDKALVWYEMAAKRGNVDAMYNIGVILCQNPDATEEELQTAVQYLTLAVENGNVAANHFLGILYVLGKGVEKDLDAGRYYLEQAAQAGFEESKELLQELDAGTQEETTPAEEQLIVNEVIEYDDPVELENVVHITEDSVNMFLHKEEYKPKKDEFDFEKMSIESLLDHAEAGSKVAMTKVGQILYDANQNAELAFSYFSKASAYDYPDALYYSACCYFKGFGVSKSDYKGLCCIARAAKFNHVRANRFLAEYYENHREYDKMMHRYHKLAEELVDGQSHCRLGCIYYQGKYCEKNYEMARFHLERGLEIDYIDSEGLAYLGVIYFMGYAGERDIDTAYRYLSLASENGNPVAHYYLAQMYIYGVCVEKDLAKAKALAEQAIGYVDGAQALVDELNIRLSR